MTKSLREAALHLLSLRVCENPPPDWQIAAAAVELTKFDALMQAWEVWRGGEEIDRHEQTMEELWEMGQL